MRVLVCGSRTYDDDLFVWETLETLHDEFGISVIIEGGAPGADDAARIWAINSAPALEEYKAEWDKHGKAAGPIRNQRMLVEGRPDLVVAFTV